MEREDNIKKEIENLQPLKNVGSLLDRNGEPLNLDRLQPAEKLGKIQRKCQELEEVVARLNEEKRVLTDRVELAEEKSDRIFTANIKMTNEKNHSISELENKIKESERSAEFFREKCVCLDTKIAKMDQELEDLKQRKSESDQALEWEKMVSDKKAELLESTLENILSKKNLGSVTPTIGEMDWDFSSPPARETAGRKRQLSTISKDVKAAARDEHGVALRNVKIRHPKSSNKSQEKSGESDPGIAAKAPDSSSSLSPQTDCMENMVVNPEQAGTMALMIANRLPVLIQAMSQHRADHEKELLSLRQEVTQLRMDKTSWDRERNQLSKEISLAKLQVSKTESKLAASGLERDEARVRLARVQLEFHAEKRKVLEAEEALDNCKSQREDYKQKVKLLAAEVKTLRKEKIDSKGLSVEKENSSRNVDAEAVAVDASLPANGSSDKGLSKDGARNLVKLRTREGIDNALSPGKQSAHNTPRDENNEPKEPLGSGSRLPKIDNQTCSYQCLLILADLSESEKNLDKLTQDSSRDAAQKLKSSRLPEIDINNCSFQCLLTLAESEKNLDKLTQDSSRDAARLFCPPWPSHQPYPAHFSTRTKSVEAGLHSTTSYVPTVESLLPMTESGVDLASKKRKALDEAPITVEDHRTYFGRNPNNFSV